MKSEPFTKCGPEPAGSAAQECEVPVHLTDDPMRTVALGVGRLLAALPEGRRARASAHGGR